MKKILLSLACYLSLIATQAGNDNYTTICQDTISQQISCCIAVEGDFELPSTLGHPRFIRLSQL